MSAGMAAGMARDWGAHLSVDSWASLSTAAIAFAPSTPMALLLSLPSGREARHLKSVHGALTCVDCRGVKAAAHLSSFRLVLPLSPSHSAVMPSAV